jgi:heme-degrading monooxygenase HmoA
MKTQWHQTQPAAPFYAVIFISRKGKNLSGYAQTDAEMLATAQKQAGYLGYSSVGQQDQSIFISYWQNKAAIEAWRHHRGHKKAKAAAPGWYAYYHSLICKVESHREFTAEVKNLS